jgi:succinylglutamate desuccinylase
VLAQKLTGGDPKPILHPDDVIGIQIHIDIHTAFREAGNVRMTFKPKRPITYWL